MVGRRSTLWPRQRAAVNRSGVTKSKGSRDDSRKPPICWSSRPDSNRRRPAWEIGIPLYTLSWFSRRPVRTGERVSSLLPTFCQKRCQKLRRLSGPAPEKASRPLPATPRRLVLVESGVTPVDRRADLCRPPRQPGQPKFPRSPAGKPRGALRSGRDARGHGIRTRV